MWPQAMHRWRLALLAIAAAMATRAAAQLPPDFVYLSDVAPSINQSVRYYSTENFMQRRMVGYYVPTIVMTQQAAVALKAAQEEFLSLGYTIVVYDAYRPQRTVDSFVAWSKDLNDTAGKAKYYPTLEKSELFPDGYIAAKSGHTRGSTVDLTIMPLSHSLHAVQVHHTTLTDGEVIPLLDDGTLNMGSSFDLFHPVSHGDSTLVNDTFMARRNFLRRIMVKHGFTPLKEEWWHYTLANEPFPNTYFDFVVTSMPGPA